MNLHGKEINIGGLPSRTMHLLTNEGCVLVTLFIHFIFLVFIATHLNTSCLLVLQIKWSGFLRWSRFLRGSRLLRLLRWSWHVRFLRLLR